VEHYLDDLASLAHNESLPHGVAVADVTKKLYEELLAGTNSKTLPVIRYVEEGVCSELFTNSISDRFKDGNLVYDSRRKTWQSSRDCIWAKESIQIPGKFSVQDQYGNLEHFFISSLEVEAPSLALHVEGLKKTASPSPAFDDIRQRIRNICQFNPAEADLVSLLSCKCLPVTRADGSWCWMSPEDDFAINDRREYQELFRGMINILRFSLEDVHDFRPFLMGIGLGYQYLSKLVVLNTSAEGDEKDELLTADLRRKAYAICR